MKKSIFLIFFILASSVFAQSFGQFKGLSPLRPDFSMNLNATKETSDESNGLKISFISGANYILLDDDDLIPFIQIRLTTKKGWQAFIECGLGTETSEYTLGVAKSLVNKPHIDFSLGFAGTYISQESKKTNYYGYYSYTEQVYKDTFAFGADFYLLFKATKNLGIATNLFYGLDDESNSVVNTKLGIALSF
ncbi:hypothetical protein [Treponema zioleckii]|uniref:hypothetical protein n=1 Tax=Treponema zioleckii TaxID=331680 RepID=UPI00168A4CB2|nr:hypothetical protein [Treponema zioleckii]